MIHSAEANETSAISPISFRAGVGHETSESIFCIYLSGQKKYI